jgi:hypothetical protein
MAISARLSLSQSLHNFWVPHMASQLAGFSHRRDETTPTITVFATRFRRWIRHEMRCHLIAVLHTQRPNICLTQPTHNLTQMSYHTPFPTPASSSRGGIFPGARHPPSDHPLFVTLALPHLVPARTTAAPPPVPSWDSSRRTALAEMRGAVSATRAELRVVVGTRSRAVVPRGVDAVFACIVAEQPDMPRADNAIDDNYAAMPPYTALRGVAVPWCRVGPAVRRGSGWAVQMRIVIDSMPALDRLGRELLVS